MTPLTTLSRLLRDIHDPKSHTHFRSYVLERLSEAVAFDSAAWASGTMTAQGPDFHTITLWNQPPQLLRDYEQIKHLDPLFIESARQPGRPVWATARTSLPPAFMPFVDRYGLEQALSTIHTDSLSHLLTGVSLWRSNPRMPFTEADAAMVEAAFPHLMQAASRRVLQELEHGDAPDLTECRAAIDLRGRLHCADSVFADRLASEFPDWRGPELPESLLPAVTAASTRLPIVLRQTAVITARRGDLISVRLRALAAIDELTGRQREVVDLVGQGLNHKQIARRLRVSPATVRNHIAHAYERLGVRNRSELAALVHRFK